MSVSPSLLRAVPLATASRLVGKLADQAVPGPVASTLIRAFRGAYPVNLDEADVPAGGFRSFDAFFTRRLRAGARRIDHDATLVSPCDGRVDAVGTISDDLSLTVKAVRYAVSEIVGDENVARYRGGSYALIYLAPPDYHRVHAPVDGLVSFMRYVPGELFPVNRLGTRFVPKLFAINERVVVEQTSEQGKVTTVLVGATVVGRISLAFHSLQSNVGHRALKVDYGDGGPYLARGAELGCFHLGSTVILLAEPSLRVSWGTSTGNRVWVGEPLTKP